MMTPFMMIPLLVADPIDHVLPHKLFRIAGFWVTNQMLMVVVAAVLMLLIFPSLFRKAQSQAAQGDGGDDDVPRGAKNFFESILEFLRVEVFRPALKEHTDRFVPFLWTLFFFILFCNLLGQLPIGELFTAITGRESHITATATGTPITTTALAICAFFFIHVNGIVQVARALMNGTYGHHEHHEEHTSEGTLGHEAAHDLPHVRGEGLAADVPGDFRAVGNPTRHYEDDESFARGHDRNGIRQGDDGHTTGQGRGMNGLSAALLAVPLYLWNFAPHPFKPAPGGSPIAWVADFPMWLMLLVLELIGAVIKPFALMIRLFANMIAGHIVLAALVFLIPVTAGVVAQVGIGIPVTILSLLILLLEIFVAFLQTYIFVFLTTLFIASAVAPEH
jgi:F0F1-type ATP synthase membrane subunit a